MKEKKEKKKKVFWFCQSVSLRPPYSWHQIRFFPKSSDLAHPILSFSYPHSVLREASGMPAETCPHLARVAKRTTAYIPRTTSITRSGLEAQHHASRPR